MYFAKLFGNQVFNLFPILMSLWTGKAFAENNDDF